MTAANSKDCFRSCVGKTVRGVLFPDDGAKTLIFDDGTGLTIGSNGSYWTETKSDLDIKLNAKMRYLEEIKRDIEEALQAAGQA